MAGLTSLLLLKHCWIFIISQTAFRDCFFYWTIIFLKQLYMKLLCLHVQIPVLLTAKQYDSRRKLMITKGIILECTSWAEMLFAWSYLSKLFCSFNKSDPFTQMSLSVGIDREWSEPKNRGITYKTFGLKG